MKTTLRNIFILFTMLLMVTSCNKNDLQPKSQVLTKSPAANHNPLFVAEKNGFKLEISDKIDELTNRIENLDYLIYETNYSNKDIEKNNELQLEMMDYRKYLNEQLMLVDQQSPANWDEFKLAARDRTLEAKLEFKALQLNIKKTFALNN